MVGVCLKDVNSGTVNLQLIGSLALLVILGEAFLIPSWLNTVFNSGRRFKSIEIAYDFNKLRGFLDFLINNLFG